MNLDYFDDILDPDYRLRRVLYSTTNVGVDNLLFEFEKEKNILFHINDLGLLEIEKNILKYHQFCVVNNFLLKEAIGLYPLWIRVIQNRQSVLTGLQIELCDLYALEGKECTIQVRCEANSLYLYKLEDLNLSMDNREADFSV